MTKVNVMCLFIVLVCSLCQSYTAHGGQWKQFESKENGFSIRYPATWSVWTESEILALAGGSTDPKPSFAVQAPDKSSFYIVIRDVKPSQKILNENDRKEYLRTIFKQMCAGDPFALSETPFSAEFITLTGVLALQYTFEMPEIFGVRLVNKYWCIHTGKREFLIGATAKKSDFADVDKEFFTPMIQSLRIAELQDIRKGDVDTPGVWTEATIEQQSEETETVNLGPGKMLTAELLQCAMEEPDLAIAVLTISGHFTNSCLDVQRYISILDDMASDVRARLKDRELKANQDAIVVMNEYLFDELGFEALDNHKPDYLLLHSVLDNKQGNSMSLSILYLSLGRRLGLPLYGVVVPGHFLVRYDDGQVRRNIETTSEGRHANDEYYIRRFKVPLDNKDSIYVKNLKAVQTLGCFLNNLANSYSDSGDLETALSLLQNGIRINPSLSELHANLGNIYLKKGLLQHALDQYTKALSINPNDPKSHNNLGNAYFKMGQLKKAIVEYEQSIKLDQEFVDGYRNLALTHVRLGRPERAEGLLKHALGLKPGHADCQRELGEAYYRMGKNEQAVHQFEKALKTRPDFAEVFPRKSLS